MLTVLDRLEGMAAVGTQEFQWGDKLFAIDKCLAADLAFELTTAAAVVIDIFMRGSTERANGIAWNIMGFAFLGFHGRCGFSIAEAIVLIPELPVLFDKGFDDGELVGQELLVLRTVKFIVCPLLERDVSCNKKNEPADLFVLVLNN
jgi:hypothetical protein